MGSWKVGSTIPGVDVVASDRVSGASGWVVGASGVTSKRAARAVLAGLLIPILVPVLVPVPILVSVGNVARMVQLPPFVLRVGGALAFP